MRRSPLQASLASRPASALSRLRPLPRARRSFVAAARSLSRAPPTCVPPPSNQPAAPVQGLGLGRRLIVVVVVSIGFLRAGKNPTHCAADGKDVYMSSDEALSLACENLIGGNKVEAQAFPEANQPSGTAAPPTRILPG